MKLIDKMVEYFTRLNKRMKRWQRAVSVLSAIVVFVTTYALILPAITLDVDTASTQAGIEVASENEPDAAGTVYESAEEEADDGSSEEEEITESSDNGSAVTESSTQEDAAAATTSKAADTVASTAASTAESVIADTAAAASTEEAPALITEATQLTYQGKDYIVYADFDGSAQLPVGVELKAKEITKESDPEAYEVYYKKALEELKDKYDENTGLSFAKFYDISFVFKGQEVEPKGNVNIKIEYKEAVEIEEQTKVDTIHFNKEDEEKAEIIDSEKEVKDDTKVESVEFESDKFSVYGVIGTETFTEKFLTEDGETYNISVTAGAEAHIPADAHLEISEVKEGSDKYDELFAKAQAAVTDGKDASVPFARFFDIAIVKDGEKIQPDAPVDVKISFDETVEANKNAVFNAVHISDDGENVDVLDVETDGEESEEAVAVNAVQFSAEGFSIYGVTYTVDFTYEGSTWSFPGRGHYNLNEVLPIIGVSVPETGIDEVTLTLIDGKEIEGALYLTKEEDIWYLNSDVAFDSTYELLVKINSDTYVITITDDQASQNAGTDDLSKFLGDVTIDNVDTSETAPDGKVKVGREYTMHFSFAETGNNQFNVNKPLTYKVPDGIIMKDIDGTFNITYKGQTYPGNTYTYDKSTNTITVNFTDTVRALVSKSPDAMFTIDISGSFTGEKDHFEFGNNQNKTLELDNNHKVTVNKSGSYLSDDNKVHYTITASSSGQSNNVVISDTVTGSALTLDPNSIKVNGRTSGYSIEPSGNGFVVKLDQMSDNETVNITYTASVNFNNITGKGTVTQTGNTVKITADNDPGEEKPTDLHNQIDYNPLNKTSGEATGEGNTKTKPWTITINEQQLKSMAGTPITDKNNSTDVMKYTGDGITVTVMDGNRRVRVINVPWSELNISDPSKATQWTYTLPDTEDDRNNTYKYIITYDTIVDTTGKITDFTVNNSVEDNEGHKKDEPGKVGPGNDKVTLEKENTSFSAGTSNWKISFNVPKNGLSSAVLTDYMPQMYYGGEHWMDALEGELSITGLIENESYSIDTSDASKVVVTFYKSGEKTKDNEGLIESDSDRTITVTLTTANNPDWVIAHSGSAHTNNAELNVNGQVVTDSDNSYPKSEGVSKVGSHTETVNIGGREYPVFKYTLSLYGVNDSSFKNNKLTLTDTFDNTLLKLYDGKDDAFKVYYNYNYGNAAEHSVSGNTLTITADKSLFGKDGNDMYYSVYQFNYYLIPADLDKIEKASISAEDHKVPIYNEVYWGDFHDDVTIDYEYPAVDKTQLTSADSAGYVKYKIVLNPDKLELNGGDSMEMLDTATNITVDYSSIEIITEPETEISYYYRGYTGYYTIPDKTKVTITYRARVVGTGSVPISNEAVMKGFKDNTSSTETGDSSGSGSLNIDWVVLYKHEWRKMHKPLNGAVYVLCDSHGNPVVYPANSTHDIGKPVTFTTGRIDLNALPDGTYETGDPNDHNYRDGYAWIFLDKDKDGLALQKGVQYYFREYEAPTGYQKDDTIFQFTITDHPDYDEWEYHKGDVLRIADSETESVLEITKTFEGAENLTDTQKKQITFKITGVDADNNPIKIPYAKDQDGNVLYSDESGLEISYADFEDGKYKLELLPVGTYTVIETGKELSGYNHIETTYLVDGEQGTEPDLSGTITITDQTAHQIAYTNKYASTGTTLNIIKKDDSDKLYLYDATFQLYKKDSSGEFSVVTDLESLTSDGKFTIDYENREQGVNITGLTDGEYMIKETEAPKDYYLDETPVYFTVNNGTITAGATGHSNGDNVKTFENASVTIVDKLEHTYTLTKIDSLKLSMKLKGAQFEIYKLNKVERVDGKTTKYTFGDQIGSTLTTDENGQIIIDTRDYDLDEASIYCVKEVKAPEGYSLTDKVYSFYIGENAPSAATTLKTYGESVVSLADGPQTSIVPNQKDKMDFLVKKQWYKVNGDKLSDKNDLISSIDIKLFQVQSFEDGTENVIQYPDDNTIFKMDYSYNNNWLSYYFSDLPTGNSVNTDNPVTYSYYVEEVVPEGYVAKYVLGSANSDNPEDIKADSDGDIIEVRNSPKPVNYNVKKVWLDDGIGRPGSITVTLYYIDGKGEKIYPNDDVLGGQKRDQTLNENNGWSFHWSTLDPGTEDDPKTYYVEEYDNKAPSGYVVGYQYSEDNTSTTVTNAKKVSDKLKVKKVWLNSDGSIMDAPDIPVTVKLQKEEGIPGNGHTVTVNTWYNYHSWQCSEKRVEVTDGSSISINLNSGSNIYLGTPQDPDDDLLGKWNYVYSVDSITSDIVLNFKTDPNNYIDSSLSNYSEPEVDWSGVITDVTTDDGIKMDGHDLTEEDILVTLNKDNGWIHEWNKLSAPEGKTYRYSVHEIDVPAGFEVSYENNGVVETGIIYVKNTESEYTRATGHKEWQDSEGNTIAAPSGAEVVFALYQDGRKMAKTVTLDGTTDENGEPEAWVATWEGLEKNKADGTPHVYTVTELTGYTGYAAEYVDPIEEGGETLDFIASGGTIINKESRTLTAVKVWKDENGRDITSDDLPEGATVTIELLKDGDSTGRSITLDGRADPNGEQKPWEATFSDLDKTGIYTIKETDKPVGFKMVSIETTSGNPDSGSCTVTVTNQKVKTVHVTKIWRDEQGDNKAWDENVESITLILQRKIGSSRDYDSTFGTNGKVTITVPKPEGIDPTAAIMNPVVSGSNAYVVQASLDPKDGYTITVDGLPEKVNNEEAHYFFYEDPVDNYKTLYGITGITGSGSEEGPAESGNQIINVPATAVTLPSTGGPGTKLFYGLGISLVGFAGLLLFIKRRELRDLSKRRW